MTAIMAQRAVEESKEKHMCGLHYPKRISLVTFKAPCSCLKSRSTQYMGTWDLKHIQTTHIQLISNQNLGCHTIYMLRKQIMTKGVVWISCFLSSITLFSSPITQNWWVPQQKGVFGFVFSFCFHHLILWFFSDELAKLKTTFWCFQVIETKL